MLMKKSVTIYLILVLLVSGCTNNGQNAENFKPKDRAPDSLTELVSNLDDIFESIADIEKLAMNIPLSEEELKAQQEEQGQGQIEEESQGVEGEESGQESSQGSQGGAQGGQSQGQQQPQASPMTNEEKAIDLWKEIEIKLDEAHRKWNEYEAEALKKGATKEAGDGFESVFNTFTKSVESKNLVGVYDYGSQSFSKLKPFYDLYLDDVGGDVSTLKYAAYQSYVRAIQGNIPGAAEILNGREENINKIRIKVEDDDQKKNSVEKAALALTDFREALTENSRRLYMIKKDVIIENLKDI